MELYIIALIVILGAIIMAIICKCSIIVWTNEGCLSYGLCDLIPWSDIYQKIVTAKKYPKQGYDVSSNLVSNIVIQSSDPIDIPERYDDLV